MPPTAQLPFAKALSADYSGAILVGRSAKNWLFLLLMVVLLTQVGIFCLFRFQTDIDPASKSFGLLQYVIAITDFAGIALGIVLSLVLLLIVNIMLVGRVIGLERVTSAYVWCLLLLVLLFPWQTVLNSPANTPPAGPASTAAPQPATEPITSAPPPAPATSPAASPPAAPADFKIPGVLYTWAELTHPEVGARFATTDTFAAMLHWSRYVVFPLLAVLLLLLVQSKSSQGLKMAMGEAGYRPPAEESQKKLE